MTGREEIERIVAETRAAQGLPPRVEDATTLTKVAGLVRTSTAHQSTDEHETAVAAA